MWNLSTVLATWEGDTSLRYACAWNPSFWEGSYVSVSAARINTSDVSLVILPVSWYSTISYTRQKKQDDCSPGGIAVCQQNGDNQRLLCYWELSHFSYTITTAGTSFTSQAIPVKYKLHKALFAIVFQRPAPPSFFFSFFSTVRKALKFFVKKGIILPVKLLVSPWLLLDLLICTALLW